MVAIIKATQRQVTELQSLKIFTQSKAEIQVCNNLCNEEFIMVGTQRKGGKHRTAFYLPDQS